ncbi:MAG: hypothetical protein CVT49_00775 [candidate division Zixibacteria bacterium HGW-Zixibacteria-1]|nr:MAG: hypothetical protein CVT49_00775 [candidate division Zixibacteria bacterium HGW-Zixibacteria-1]
MCGYLLPSKNASGYFVSSFFVLILLGILILHPANMVSAQSDSKERVLVDRQFTVQGVVQGKLGTWEPNLKPLYDLENQDIYTYIDDDDRAYNFSLVITDLSDAVRVYKSDLSTPQNKQGLDYDRVDGNYAPMAKMFMLEIHPYSEDFDRKRDTCLTFTRLGQAKGTRPAIGHQESVRFENVKYTFTILDYEIDEKWSDLPDSRRQFGYKWIKIQLTAEVK